MLKNFDLNLNLTCNISPPYTPLSPLSFPSLPFYFSPLPSYLLFILFPPPLLHSFFPLTSRYPRFLTIPFPFFPPLFSFSVIFLPHSFSQLSLHIPSLFSLSLPFLTSIPPLLSPSSPVFNCLPSLLACELAHLCDLGKNLAGSQ